MCPNCGGPIEEDRLRSGIPCRKCVPDRTLRTLAKKGIPIREYLENKHKLKNLWGLYSLEDELNEFNEFFYSLTGKNLWTIQRAWTKRMLFGESFTLIAPTGVGKTTLLLAYAIYKVLRGSNVLYIVPTRELMKHVANTIKSLRSDINIMISDDFKGSKSFDKNFIAILTHHFIFRNKELVSKHNFDLVIVDDFDALLKSSSLIDLILKVLGISEKAIELAKKVVNIKSELMFHKYTGNETKMDELKEKLYDTELELAKEVDYSSVGQLLIASATGRAKGSRVKVLRELLGFEVGSIMDYLRNMVEVYTPLDSVNIANLIKKLKGGTLIFVSKELGLKKARELVQILESKDIKVAIANSRKALDKLRNGEVDVLVGVATYYGILTRGIDEPLRIYNTVFVGVPKFEVPVENLLSNPRSFVRLLLNLRKIGYELDEDDKELLNAIQRLSPGQLKVLQAAIRGYVEVSDYLNSIKESMVERFPKILSFLREYIRNNKKYVSEHFIIVKGKRGLVAQIPDVMTYIQASGRCSRLYKGSMTLGLTIILVDDEDLYKIFDRKVRNYVPTYTPMPLDKVDLSKIKKEQVKSRKGTRVGKDVSKIKSALIVVESPTKARTIASMFGRPGKRYLGEYLVYETVISLGDVVYVTTIAPTLGHIMDLITDTGLHGIKLDGVRLKPIYSTIKRCMDCGHQFTDDVDDCPRCGSVRIRNSRKVIDALRKLAQEVDVVFLATDPDDEGEKISYDVMLLLSPYISNFKRIEFHEVTRKGFLNALMNPRDINIKRVDAQVVRRVDDRLVGFELSAVLKRYFNKPWMGGGRVQTPVLNWVVDQYMKYVKTRGYLVLIKLDNGLKIKYFVKEKDIAKEIAEIAEKDGIKLIAVNEEIKPLSPRPPYTTDSLLSDASRYLKLPTTKIMRLAQDLFELGYITYHRTDSTHVSSAGIEVAKEYLKNAGMHNLFRPRAWGHEGTHECIRPTKPMESLENSLDDFLTSFNNLTWYHLRLYELIFKRFVASQMSEAIVKQRSIKSIVGNYETTLDVIVDVINEGFLKVDYRAIYKDLGSFQDAITVKPVEVKIVRASEVHLFTPSDVIRIMKEKGIGRPSTYAKAIDSNVRHGYIIQSKKRLYLIPTKTGVEVAELINKFYPELSDAAATRELEKLLESVRSGIVSRDEALVLLMTDVVRIRVKEKLMDQVKVFTEGEAFAV
jgi:reverse gyrase